MQGSDTVKGYALYLRKSRADYDAEMRGEGETLAKHRAALTEYAKHRGLMILQEYAEVVSGDSIAARPQMQALLEDVKRGMYAGVIVNDVDRLGRGDSIDQEIIKLTFAASHTLIITPTRDIDPASPTDEDMLDFGMFMARFEYRKIAQRLSVGRTRSAQAGNYLSPRVPYGYKKVTDGNKITLEPNPETADIVRKIFEDYASGTCGYNHIAAHLNEMGIRSAMGKLWDRAAIKKILTNPVYTGRIVWGKTATISVIEDGKRIKKHIAHEPSVTENAHPALIPDELFNQVQERFASSKRATSVNIDYSLNNPFAGILFCSECGRVLQARGKRRKTENDRVLWCPTYECKTSGTYISIVMNALTDVLQGWCAMYRDKTFEPPKKSAEFSAYAKQITRLEAQLAKAHELVETGVYTPTEYLTRKTQLQEQLEAVKRNMDKPQPISKEQAIIQIVPRVERVLEALPYAQTPEEQNALLKTIVDRIEFTKSSHGKRGVSPESLLTLDVFPKISLSV